MTRHRKPEPDATIKQNVKPAPGQKYKDGGCGFTIKNIIGTIAVCQLANAQLRYIDVKKIPRYELSI